jgi:hypothetical protein
LLTKKSTMASKHSSVVGHFDGHGGVLEQYRQHHLMRHVQGFPGSYWTPPSGKYLLRIAPAAAKATANDTTIKKWTNFDGHFDGRGSAPVRYRMHRPMEEVQGFGRSHWTSPLSKYYCQ